MTARKLDSYTLEEFEEISKTLKDTENAELIFGEIVMMAGASADHQDVVGNIFFFLKEAAKRSDKKCTPRVAPFDLKLISQKTQNVVQPDVMLFCEGAKLPCVIFEVLSPATASKDRGAKKELYEYFGIKEYFIVDIEHKIVDAYILENGKYFYVRGFSLEDNMPIACFESEMAISDVFDGIDSSFIPHQQDTNKLN